MSPECLCGYFAPTWNYSPLFNDVWSLGIILLKEVNLLLMRTLKVDWCRRITLREMCLEFKSINIFYSSDVIFEDSMARCPREAGLKLILTATPPQMRSTSSMFIQGGRRTSSAWNDGSNSGMVFVCESSLNAKGTSFWTAPFDTHPEDGSAASSYSRSVSPNPDTASLYPTTTLLETLQIPGQSPVSAHSVRSSSPFIPSPLVSPHGGNTWGKSRVGRRKLVLTGDMDTHRPEYYDNSVTMLPATASSMYTALATASESNWDRYMYSPLVTSAIATAKPSPYGNEDIGIIITPSPQPRTTT